MSMSCAGYKDGDEAWARKKQEDVDVTYLKLLSLFLCVAFVYIVEGGFVNCDIYWKVVMN
jgi:hypothetical protein